MELSRLTEKQKSFLLEHFFKNEIYPGWKGIALKLLEKGACIVAGDACIWQGGIGNYIKTETAPDAFGCLVYTFNLNSFLSSIWYKDTVDDYLKELSKKIKEIETEYDDIYILYQSIEIAK